MPDRAWLLATALFAGAALTVGQSGAVAPLPSQTAPGRPHPAQAGPGDDLFRTADRCLACHKGVSTSDGLDVSIGYDWRASMMANSARDPYWQAAVRREVIDYPQAADSIEQTCSRCHMPMASVAAQAEGRPGSVFANLPVGASTDAEAVLAADGVSCAVCHQISSDALGTEPSFSGGFTISENTPPEGRPMFGPFEPDSGGVGIMHSATGFRPTEAEHVQSSELCATCHTLLTHSVRPDGGEGPEFPEQVLYLEWQASSFAAEGTSCQDCHMPEVSEEVPVTRVLGRARPEVSRHVFRGGNFFMLRMLNRYRDDLGVVALPQELSLAADRTEAHLREATAVVSVANANVTEGRLEVDVDVRNATGHKFPTAYPSRRAWLHLTVEDAGGQVVFESGAFSPDGRIVGNDNDVDASRYEPHHTEIVLPGQVQIYEGVMVDGAGLVTTGLMSADRWAKDNRLLPSGFYAGAADPRVAVLGEAASDPDFAPGADRIRYAIEVDAGAGPFIVSAELWFQPVGFRWADNLSSYDAFETNRFVRYYREMAAGSAIILTSDSALVR